MRRILVGLIRIYQKLSRFTPPTCRFQPTCSEYAAQAILQYGAMRGMWMAMKRVLRCHPWSAGGYDPVPAVSDDAGQGVQGSQEQR